MACEEPSYAVLRFFGSWDLIACAGDLWLDPYAAGASARFAFLARVFFEPRHEDEALWCGNRATEVRSWQKLMGRCNEMRGSGIKEIAEIFFGNSGRLTVALAMGGGGGG